MNELARYRAEFPVVGTRTYLISASLGPLSVRSRRLAEEHLDLWGRLRAPPPGRVPRSLRPPDRGR
jgi:hypothetical protein